MGNAEKKPKNYLLIRKPRTHAIQRLNNMVFMNNVLSNSLALYAAHVDAEEADTIEFQVPGVKGNATSKRTRENLIEMLSIARTRGLYEQALVTAVALTEDCLVTYLRLLLRSYPKKLTSTSKGIDAERTVDLVTILDAKDLNDLITSLIDKHLGNLFYSAPKDYLRHVADILAIEIPDPLVANYVEIKASRDLIIHSASRINNLYLRKAGAKARGNVGDDLPCTPTYFADAIVSMKGLITTVYQQLLKKYGDVALTM